MSIEALRANTIFKIKSFMLLSRNKSVYVNYKILFWGEKDNKNTTFFLVLFFFFATCSLKSNAVFHSEYLVFGSTYHLKQKIVKILSERKN